MEESKNFELGFCYEVKLESGETIQFRMMGGEPIMVESPINAKPLVRFDSLFTGYLSVCRISCPNSANSRI